MPIITEGDEQEPTTFVKAQGAHHAGDDESWKPADESRTLTGFEGGAARASTLAAPMPGAVRRLTATECERLQGFPDGWTMIPPK